LFAGFHGSHHPPEGRPEARRRSGTPRGNRTAGVSEPE
jgi:hypothetical protein